MKKILATIATSLFGIVMAVPAFGSDAWPATDTTGTQIAYYSDASGIVYHERLGTFFIVTNAGCVKQITTSGTEVSSYCTSAWTDFEGITAVDYESNYLYLGLESPQTIYQFDISTNSLTGRSWTLSGMSVATGLGLEGLEYSSGYFMAASQYNGKVYVYSVNLSTSGAATFVSSFYPYSGYTSDLAALSYSEETDTLYSLYDGGNRLVATDGDGTYINRYQLPSATMNEEGFVVVPNCPNGTTNVVITEDSGRIMLFSGFSIDTSRCTVAVVDADADGVNSTLDCNDNDATVSSNQTYYRDADGDGKGSASSTTSVCSATAPTGYVTNTTDSNDSDFDNDGVSSSSDCNDSDSTISAYQTYYRDADSDGLGTSTTTSVVCSYTVPTGYVTNISDSNDSDYDNDGVSTTSDCNDSDSTISAYQTYYRDADGDGLGASATTSVMCSYSAPSGYVTNASDANDSDFDNDGVSSGSDCNDSDATVSSLLTVYQDYDADGLGNPSVSQSVCALSAPSGYVTNANDIDDSGFTTTPEPTPTPEPEPTYSAVEYADNAIDDDGDGLVDEVNTLADNGIHPSYGSYDPNSTSLFASAVTEISGSTKGRILVRYADNSIYRYQVFSTSVKRTTVTSYNGTGYLLVKSGDRRKTALVNAYTGEVLDNATVTLKSHRVRVNLKKQVLRIIK